MKKMKQSILTLLAALLPAAIPGLAEAAAPVFVVTDADGNAARVGAPVSVKVDLANFAEAAAKPRLLSLIESNQGPSDAVPAQFVPDSKDSTKGELWWLMPPGPGGTRQFQLIIDKQRTAPALTARLDEKREAVDVTEGARPVLRYNQGTVPPPPVIVEMFEKSRKPPLYYARGDYIHPVYGPDGEQITDDYSTNHPHHRGICWAWPVVRWNDDVRDIWAVRVLPDQSGGVWARPVSMDRVEAGPVLAVIEAVNVWKWGDRDAIVREEVTIRAFRQENRGRFLDVEVQLTALAENVSIGGRPKATYGGFNLRTFPEFEERNIDMHIEPPTAQPRQAWFHLTGRFPGGKGLAGLALLEHVTNPDYPSFPKPQTTDHVPGQYPRWRSVQPAWPGDREVALERNKPLLLKHRIWIHRGLSDKPTLEAVWGSYAAPPHVNFKK